MEKPIWEQLLEIAHDAKRASVAAGNDPRADRAEHARQVDLARLYAELGYGLSGLALASPLDAAAEAVWTIILHRTAYDVGARPRAQAPVELSASAPTLDVRLVESAAPPDFLDALFLASAWELGAWDVSRVERAPLPPDADPVAHGIAYHVRDPYMLPDIPQSPPAALDAEAWIAACKAHGWITWSCQPMFGAPEIRRKMWLHKDQTLLGDGSRPPQQWRPWQPVWVGANHQTVIRLGRDSNGTQ